MHYSTPGFPVLHHLPEFAPGANLDVATQPSHRLLSPSSPALNLSQHQGLFKGVSSSYQVVKVSELQFSINPSNEYLGLISFRID